MKITVTGFVSVTACDFFLWGYVKGRVFVPILPRDLAHLKARIIAAVKNIDTPMLPGVWQEFEYRIDVCRVTHRYTSNISRCQKFFFIFPVTVKNSIRAGPLVFLL
jgi:hypothetical protein